MLVPPPPPSFSGLRSSRPVEAQSATSIMVDVALAGLDAATPFLGSVPRLTVGLVKKWTDEKYAKLRPMCERFIGLHKKGKRATERGDFVTMEWWDCFVRVLGQFERFAEEYEQKRRFFSYFTRMIRPVDDQQALAYFTECIDRLCTHLQHLRTEKGADVMERARTDSESTVASSP